MTAGGGKRLFLLALCFLGVLLFGGLGIWQVERRAWKLDLIARVEARIRAAPAPPPPPRSWPRLSPRDLEYRWLRVAGHFRHDRETLVDALTERGPGWWVLTPLETDDGTILVNRGLVPRERKAAATRRAGQLGGRTEVTGLARLSEPRGRFLRPNRPSQDRWYSRDVEAIAQSRGLDHVAPFFIDADSTANPGGLPIGGLTVVRFRNMHLVYALTWFALAAMSLGGLVLLLNPAQKRG